MNRRNFLKAGMFGLSGLAASAGLRIPTVFEPSALSVKADGAISLLMRDAFVEMINLERVYHWVYATEELGPRLPGMPIMAKEGQPLKVNVSNLLEHDHAFFIPGVADSGPIRPGGSRMVEFKAPAPGTYIYYDNLNAPINRVMGLHGILMVMPNEEKPINPYGSHATANVSRLFNDLGNTPLFRGNPWVPDRTFFWIYHEVDPSLNFKIQNGETIQPEIFVNEFLPRFFFLTGKIGFHATWDPDIAPHGTEGQPAIVRMATTGLMTHSIHTHGNHMYMLARNGEVSESVILRDTVAVAPLETLDVLIPFHIPPDTPPETWPPKEEGFPMLFIVHDHIETAQSADGGNYPHGMTTHIVFTGPLLTDVSGDTEDV
jgi:FtsP/CotA-like multicopper oxidase with cupredoxin domain